ncbi:MAG: MBL fold metallo-hydrolase [Cyclobacteriaceae bacterium]|nr:MBL fold metallo-hydrolase [Cyclobacteriaceae bacterium HetDA_MAG_MS6]
MKGLRKISDHIYEIGITIGPDIPLNVYMINGPKMAVVIDSGINSMFSDFMHALSTNNIAGGHLKYILHTHSHHDHIGSNYQLIEATGCEVIAPKAYAHWHSDFEKHYQEFARTFPLIFPDTAELRDEVLSILDQPHQVAGYSIEGSKYDLGDEVLLEAFAFSGHMQEEMGWFEHNSKTMILGDVITLMDIPFIHGHVDVSGYRSSLRKLSQLISQLDIQQFLFAHFEPMVPVQMIDLIDQASKYLDRIDHIIFESLQSSPLTLKQLWEGVCDRMQKQREFRSLSTVDAHVKELNSQGKLNIEEDGMISMI